MSFCVREKLARMRFAPDLSAAVDALSMAEGLSSFTSQHRPFMDPTLEVISTMNIDGSLERLSGSMS
jgi:hypothetical protein